MSFMPDLSLSDLEAHLIAERESFNAERPPNEIADDWFSVIVDIEAEIAARPATSVGDLIVKMRRLRYWAVDVAGGDELVERQIDTTLEYLEGLANQ